MSGRDDILAFAHIGDLHLTSGDQDNARDMSAIFAQLREIEGLDFVFLPGDNADDGKPEQYALLKAELDGFPLPAHIITGDHDVEGGGLGPFYDMLGARSLPYAEDVAGVRCLFLDISGPGSGGPDFRLGAEQRGWFERELHDAEVGGLPVAVFMHSYPADLKGDGEAGEIAELIARSPARLVEMGHTHYNELANDGRTIFAATRSTGQIEEGAVGYALVALDRGVVSWRFKPVEESWPFVMVTAPSDRRLAFDERDGEHVVGVSCEVRAIAFGAAPIVACECRIDGGPWIAMARAESDRRFRATVEWPAGAAKITVRATDETGGADEDFIEPAVEGWTPPVSRGSGSDLDAIGEWTQKGLLGTQLGPNRNGRKWGSR